MASCKKVPLFEVPGLENLKKLIEQDFGKEGIERVKKSKLEIKFIEKDMYLGFTRSEICGGVYAFGTVGIRYGIGSDVYKIGYNAENIDEISREVPEKGASDIIKLKLLNKNPNTNHIIEFEFF